MEIKQRVRGNALYAGLGAALLIYFGWFQGTWLWDAATWSGRGIWLIMVAMQAGGLLMGAAALLCLTGKPAALMLDSMTTMAVGLSLTIGSVLFFGNGGTNAILYLVLGLFLSNSGYRSWLEYRALTLLLASARTAPDDAAPPPTLPVPDAHIRQYSLAATKAEPVEERPQLAAPPPPEGYLAAFGRSEKDDEGAQQP